METIRHSIATGWGKGALYAALAYDANDKYGGLAIKQVRFNPAAGTTAITIGDPTTELSYTAGTPLFILYATTTNATSTNAEPFYVKSTLTGSGKGGRSRFHTYSDVSVSGNNMALKAQMEYGDSGKTGSGLAAAFCAELVMPNANTGTGGAYCVLELEYVAGGTSLVTAGNLAGNHVSFIRAANSGDANGDFDDHGFFMSIQGLTAAANHLLSLTSHTLKCGIGTSTRYLVLSQLQDGLGLGTSGTPMVQTYNGNKAVGIYTTCASTNTGTSFEPVLINTVLTGAGQVGGRVKINMSTDVVLGGWANALKAQVECNTDGRCTGTLSAFCGEVVMPASDVSALGGSYAALEAEINTPASSVANEKTSFIYFGTGGNSTAIAAFQDAGNLFEFVGLGTASSAENLFHTTGTVSATHGLRVRIDNVFYDILLKASTYA